ncbi:rho GTPase-activating protein 24-like [Sinocyclocheilus rhinocerous]|uniref:rho GTPase-activating protein 24-like n=1 Tax=Sinocyclocheilus rhinocerous TaxID=307959 RepID=UPI0007B88FE7|nr:PREDICTED: rho GTPase-activating protein 24-like [Sinocyclocheilus rhinocerous]XP_016381872.1 PREDICTED: rho GTPase-activating protein 24-like [Sinocyclocheilus rhinocerous]
MDEQAGSAGNSPQHGRGSARQDVLRCGWLRKQGGFVKTWHTRWFVLRGDQLYYYKDEDETKALGTISLPGNRVTEHPSNGEEGGKFLFEVIPEGSDKTQMSLSCGG